MRILMLTARLLKAQRLERRVRFARGANTPRFAMKLQRRGHPLGFLLNSLLLGRCGWRLLAFILVLIVGGLVVLVVGCFLVGDVLAVVDDARRGVVLLVVGELDDVAHVDVAACVEGEMQGAFGLGVGGEPVFAVNLLVVGGEGRLQVLVAFARVLRDGHAVDQDDLIVLLVDPDFSLEVVFVFFDGLGGHGEGVGVELVDVLAAEVVDLVFGLVFGGEDEGQAVLDLVEVGGGHHDALESVLGGEDDVLFAFAVFVEGDVGDLLVLAVDAVVVFGDGVDFDGLAVGVIFAGLLEGGFTLAEFFDDLVGGDAGGRGGVEATEAGGFLRGGSVWNCDTGEGWGGAGR